MSAELRPEQSAGSARQRGRTRQAQTEIDPLVRDLAQALVQLSQRVSPLSGQLATVMPPSGGSSQRGRNNLSLDMLSVFFQYLGAGALGFAGNVLASIVSSTAGQLQVSQVVYFASALTGALLFFILWAVFRNFSRS